MGYDSGNVVEALRDCLSLPTIEAPTFCVQKQEDVSRKMSPLFVHKKHRHCPNCVHTETERYKHSPGVPMALVVSFKRRLQILKVLLMLLIIAGDVETNPGPVPKLKLANLYKELCELTNPISFGKELHIPQLELDRIQDDDPNDINKQKMALCQYIVKELHGIDWDKIADALKSISMEYLAVKIRQSYCQQDCSSSDSSTEYLSAEEELTQTAPLSSQLTPDRQVQLPTVQDGEKAPHSRTSRVRGEPKKQQKQETSDASVSATMGPPRPSTKVTFQRLVKRHHLTDVQLNREIGRDDIPLLAIYFDKIELYPKLMNLNPAEEQDVINTLHASSQVAMIKCLSLWKGHDPFKATYVALLEMLLRLEKGEIANNICLYLAAKNESSGALNRESISSDLSDSSESFTSIASDYATDSVSSLGSQQVPRLQFECGCGQCTVYGFITGETCPNPKAFPFPKLEIYGIPSDDIDYIEIKLHQQSTKLHRSFCELVLDTFNEMLERSVDVQKLIVYLKMLLKPKWYFPLTSSQVLDCLDDLESFDDIGVYLTKQQYCSWFDYELIEHLRNKYLFTSSDSVLDDYKAKFKVYVSQRCFIYLNDEGPWPKHQVKVKFKLDFQYEQLSHNVIKHLKCVFADILGSPNYHLCFKQAREGCTELVFGAPPYFGEIRQLSKYQKSQLKAHGFLKVIIMEQDFLEVDPEKVKLKDTNSVSSLDNSELGEISSTCSEGDNETSDGEEADIDTTDLEYTTGPGSTVEVTYDLILTNVCESELELQEEMDLDVSPCSLWKALHSGQQCMALKYNGEGDVLNFSKYIEDMQQNKRNVMPSKCVHFDAKLSSHPVILFEVQQPFNDYCFSSEVLSEMQQLSLLLNAAISVLGFSSSITLQMTTESLFVHTTSTDDITSTDDTKAMFLPMYEHSYFHQLVPKTQPELPSLNWLKDTLLLMVHRKQCNSNSKLSENHILFNIFKHRWFPDDKPGYSSTADVAKELQHILELEKTRLEMIDTLADSEYLEVPHLHMLLIGHTGVGKTSIRKHLQNIPFNDEEKSTIIMEQELLYQETFESTVDSKKSTVVFEKYNSVYKSNPDNIYLTLWDIGGQPMFQDLLPCFAKIRSIYGIIVRLCDLLDNSNASIRPTCPIEIEREAPYTSTDYLYRCISFIESTLLDLHLNNLPDMLNKRVFEVASGTAFPKIAFIGTFKDQINIEDKQDLEQICFRLKNNLNSLGTDFLENIIFPSTSPTNSFMFEIDNTRSGAKYEDLGMKALREQIVFCTKSAKAKIPNKWIAFKIDLERESRLQQPCTGIVTFEKASEIAKQHKTDLKAALCYFHELGIFIWYHDKKHLQEYVFVEPKNLLSILGTILDPQVYTDLPKQWKQLQTQGILNVQVVEQLLADSKTGLPLSWILSFFQEHHLAMPLLEGYFIPSMLQVLPICPNHQHVFDANLSACSVLPANLKVAPLFLAPRSKFVPPGFFPRLMTVLSGIKEGNILWKLSPDVINCKNTVSFDINNQFRLVFTEFIDCVRAHFDGLSNDNIPQRDVCLQIVFTLNVQLQRVINTKLIRLTFVCSYSEHSSSIHFLKYLPFATDDLVSCGEHPGKTMELTAAHKIWLSDEHHPKIATLKDAEARFEAAMKGKKFGLRFTTILFTGLPGSDVHTCKRLIMDKNFTPFESPHSLDHSFEFSYYTVSDEKIKPLHDDDSDMVFACNAAVQTPKGAKNDKSDEHSIQQSEEASIDCQTEPDEHFPQQRPKEASSKNSASDRSKQESSAQSVGKEVEVPSSIPAGNSSQHLTSNQILIYEPIPKESLLKCVSPENILQLMVNRDRLLTKDFDNLNIINCVCCSDVWLLNVLPIFLKGIAIGINCMSSSQDLEGKIILQKILVPETEIEADVSFTNKQLIKDISMLATKLMVIETHAEVESIEKNSEILFRDNEQAKLIADKNGKQEVFEVGKSLREIENIERQLVSSLDLSELKQVSLFWHMLGHAIKKVMQQYNRNFISKQEVLTIAAEFRMSETDLEIALLSLHITGVILYFGNVLPNVIFKDSTVLIQLIAKINLFDLQHNRGAIIPFSAFEVCEVMYAEGLFTCKEAISLFKDLHLLIEMKNSLFLMPCLLREEVSVETFSFVSGLKDTKVAPLVIQCLLAHGCFEYIMCYLCSQYNGHPWPWKIDVRRDLFKSFVQFILPGVNALINVYRKEDAELTVYINSNSMQDYQFLPFIRTAIVTGLNKAAEAFHITGQALPVVGFHCTCGQVDNTHMIVPSTEGHWRCSATNEKLALFSTQDIWFTKIHDSADAVTVHNVFAELIPWSSSWYKVGMLFNLESDALETITVQCRQDTDAALMEVIRKWFHTHHNPSWEEVQQVISNLKQSDDSLIERYSMTEDVFKECLPNLTLFVSISTLLPYLLKYRLVHRADVDSVQSPNLDNSTKISNLLNLTKRNGGKNGFALLYDCLFKTSEEHRGHDKIVQELERYALSSSTMNPIAIDPSILEPPDADYAVESVDALIREVSDHIGRDWMVLARSLGFTEIDIQLIDIQSIEYADERDLKEQIYRFFNEWKRRDGQDATRDKLVTVLYESGLNEVVLKTTDAQKIDQNHQKINDDLTIFLDEPLGSGAFGAVFKGSYRGDPCAIKLLHQVAMEMQTNIPATKSEDASNAIDRESDFLKSFQHPNVVQFLSTAKHPKSGGTILVVELMDCNLRSYFSGLDEEPLSSECEISLSKDMACGLAYIHSKLIIHRDLCGDNVLLKLTLPVPVAKISDFGMSQLYDPSKLSSTLTAIGQRRGYLPPEAYRLEEENYDNSLDVFSFGVILTQIVCKLETIKSAKDRSFHVAQIPHTHRLRKLIDSCLQEDMTRRPSARDIYVSLTRDSDSVEATKRETLLVEKFEDFHQRSHVQSHMEQIEHKDAELVRRDAIIQQQRQGPPPRELRPPLTLKWRRGKDMPIKMSYSVQSVVIGDTVYVGGGNAVSDRDKCTVMKLEQDQWTKLPEYTAQWFAMTSLANRLVLVGGHDTRNNKQTNQLSIFESVEWTHPYPPINIARHSSTAVSINNHIIVAGGFDDKKYTSSVEVLDVASRRWYIAQSLPNAQSGLKSTLIGNTLYLMGGLDHTGPTKKLHQVNLNELIAKALSNLDTPTLWQTLQEVPLQWSAPLSIGRSLLAVGGRDSRVNPSSSIHLYQPDTRRWVKVGDLPTARYCCTCSVLPCGEVIVAGGETETSYIRTVEFLSIS
ncbi:uncharacterized protein LOC135337585 isoform X3 [Halichondria panicea]|uniref:uncharacterized protein LOC135337585 isoform X3 n=1 Tax=Halichondria panicea TaxID=6063 RepID=UPI00312B4DB2